MKRFLKILLPILLVLLLAALGGFLLAQRDNLKALQNSLQYTTQELEDQLAENHQAVQDAVAQFPNLTVRDLTDEEKESLQKGQITADELAQALTKPVQNNAETQGNAEEAPSAAEQQFQQDLSALIAKVYVLREEYTIALGNLQSQAYGEYQSFPANQRKSTALVKWASGYLGQATAMEKECDAKMDELIDQIESLLKANGKDLSTSDAIYEAYLNEKSIKKSWYLSKLKERGLL